LPNDAYPILENAIVWREQIRRKQGFTNIENGNPASSQLSRLLTAAAFTTVASTGTYPQTFSFSVITQLIAAGSITAQESNAGIATGSASNPISIVIGAQTLTDSTGTGTLTVSGAGPITAALLSYSRGNLILTVSSALGATAATFTGFYYPLLPVMGLRIEETADSAFDTTVAWDTVYAYVYNNASNSWNEFLPGTTWTGTNSQFMWTTNYFLDKSGFKVFWATNNKDPIRYTNGQGGTNWVNFAPIVNAGGGTLTNCLAMLPFRGRLVVFNTTIAGSDGGIFTNQVRWSAIGTPFTVVSPIVTTVNANAWRDDIRGQGGFLNIPTSEDIVAVGFVRDNLVIYCERSTWQLRYTGRTIAPFQIERVNSELGAQSTFSAVQFDTSLVGIGDKGVVECDSYKSERIDIKIPDIVFSFTNAMNEGNTRIQGIRDFVSRLAYWTYPSNDRAVSTTQGIFPNKLLTYNYENDSWAIFDNSFTALGTFQTTVDRTWVNTMIPWIDCDFPWISEPDGDPVIVAGNQQGFVVILGNFVQDYGSTGASNNDPNLVITAITGNSTTATVITSPNHNLQGYDADDGSYPYDAIIEISGILPGTPFANLNTGIDPNTGLPFNNNNGIFAAQVIDANTFKLMVYNPTTLQFSTPQLDAPNTGYLGTGYIAVRDNFNVTSKKFNFLEEGQNIQMGYFDILMASTPSGAISVNVYIDYDDDNATNTLPSNVIATGSTSYQPDTFFNATIPTTKGGIGNVIGSKYWQRVYCPTRGNFLTLQYEFNNAQMAGIEQTQDVEIDAQVLWMRRAGRLTAP
jgi:hypothetical protein